MPDRKLSVGVHVGAHKTATTHFQRSVLAVRDDLAGLGVRFHGPRSFRWGQPSLLAQFGIPNGPKDAGIPALPGALDRLAEDAARLVVSEENLLGTFLNRSHRVRRPLYPDAVRRLARLSPLMTPDGLDLYLGIRNPADMLNSAYSQLILSGQRLSVADYVARNAIRLIDWAELATRLARAPGVASLTVWRFEDYAPLFGTICRAMLGEGAAARVQPLPGRWHQGLSARAVDALIGDPALSVDDAMAQFPKGAAFAGIDVCDADTHALSVEYYDTQCAQVAAIPGVTFLRPAPT